jgi:hypothetical protein
MARAMNPPVPPAVLSGRAELEALCDRLARAGAPCLPLARAAADGLLSLVSLHDPSAPWPASTFGALVPPVVVIVGDDPGPDLARGPAGWRSAKRLRRWCAWAMIHGAGGEPAHYSAVLGAAALMHRAVLVETSSALAPAWRGFLGAPGLTILPPPGLPHPVRPVLQ